MKHDMILLATVAYLVTATFAYGQGNAATDLPVIGKWLIDGKGEIAHWLGAKYQDKLLYEPINVVIVDRLSTSMEEAIRKLKSEANRCGYEQNLGHSADYSAFIDGISYDQITPEIPVAFSNKEFFQTNNHGRIMGPSYWHGAFIFVGAFSREALRLKPAISHSFVSFKMARDDFCTQMDSIGGYRIVAAHDMGNILEDAVRTTADHDGMAIVLEARR